MCVALPLPLGLLTINGVMWHDMDPVCLVKQGLQPLYGSYSQYC